MNNIIRQYTRKANNVAAVQLNFTNGDDDRISLFKYHKWGDVQKCKPGDWVVYNQGETYTIDKESFESTYEQVSLGVYKKVSSVWAKEASEDGKLKTKEGYTHFKEGDMIVSNDAEFDDSYAMSREKFDELYESVY